MTATATGLAVIPCRVGRGRYAVPAGAVASILGQGAFKPSAVSSGPLGFVRHAGVETPVYSLLDLVGLRVGAPRGLSSIVVMRGEPAWAIAVEAAGAPLELPLEKLYSVPRPLAGPLEGKVRGVAAVDEGVCCLLDLRRLAPESDATADVAEVRPIESAFRFPVRAQGRPQIFRFQPPGEGADAPTLVVSAGQTVAALPPPPEPGFADAHRALGMIVFQGIPVPVLDLGSTLGLAPTRYQHATKLLLVRGRDSSQLSALPVGANLRLAETPAASRRVAPPPGIRGLLGAFEAEGKQLWALDIDAALSSETDRTL